MYLLCIYFENAQKNGTDKFCFTNNHGKIHKWTLFSAHKSNRELLQLMATGMGGNFDPEWWQLWSGIGGSFAPEYAVMEITGKI